MEPVGFSRKLALMPAGHGKGGAGTLRPAISIHEIIRTLYPEAGRGGKKSHKCGKTHIFLAWALAGLEG